MSLLRATSSTPAIHRLLVWMAVLLAVASCREPARQGPSGASDDHAGAPPRAVPAVVTLPGAEPFAPDLVARMQQALAARGPQDDPHSGPRTGLYHGAHTRHWTPDHTPRYINRLILEPSPYLQRHAHNPVDWHPWGPEAFAAARRLNRPVLLSAGYSTCHWCHVMADESFDDPEIAAYLNAHYIAIKVDREERPDVDNLYLTAVQITSGQGAWPTTVWLTPARAPFFGGTYLPPRARDGKQGLLELLQRKAHEHDSDPEGIARSAEQLVAAVRRLLDPGDPAPFSREDAVAAMDSAAGAFESHFDPENGGVRGTLKHPATLPVRFLLRHHRRTGEDIFLHMATRTLEAMVAGGIHDQVGGGFHHYAADARWQVPHFEKLLFDNALLVVTYLEAYQATGREDFAEVARDVLRFLDRDLGAPGSVYHAGLAADSLGTRGRLEEGAFYTWLPDELARALAPPRAALARAYFGVTGSGPVHGRSVLVRARPLAAAAADLGLDPDDAHALLPDIREALLRARARRPAPLRDDKILTDWNALTISAQARAAMVLGEPSHLEGARQTARFLLGRARPGQRLHHVVQGGRARIPAYLTDHAMLAAALLDLFEATGEVEWLERAIALEQEMHARFADQARGGYFFTGDVHGELPIREKPSYDGTLPSGSSVAALVLLRLHAITGKPAYLERAEALFAALAPVVLEDPARMSDLLLALDFWTDEAKQIVIALPARQEERGGSWTAPWTDIDAWPMLDLLGRRFVPNAVRIPAAARGALAELAPVVQGKIAQDGRATAYVCTQGRCEAGTRDLGVFAAQIARVTPLP